MLIRCNVDHQTGVVDLDQCRRLALFFKERDYNVAYAVNRDGYETARRFLGEKTPIFRLPPGEEEEVDRMSHLQRKHGHQMLVIYLRKTTSTYLFQMRRLFGFTLVRHTNQNHVIYADLLLNPEPGAGDLSYDCNQEARLLLGPKFHIADPTPVSPPPQPIRPDHILVDLGEVSDPLLALLDGLIKIPNCPPVHVLLEDDSMLRRKLIRLRGAHPQLGLELIERPLQELFPYDRYTFLILKADMSCMEIAHKGLFFMTVPVVREQLEFSYSLAQKGVSPSLGWHRSRTASETAGEIRRFLENPVARANHAREALSLVDGLGLHRIAHFVPKEEHTLPPLWHEDEDEGFD